GASPCSGVPRGDGTQPPGDVALPARGGPWALRPPALRTHGWPTVRGGPLMTALVVVETYFGNTRHFAEMVAGVLRSGGIGTEVVGIEDAPTRFDDEI